MQRGQIFPAAASPDRNRLHCRIENGRRRNGQREKSRLYPVSRFEYRHSRIFQVQQIFFGGNIRADRHKFQFVKMDAAGGHILLYFHRLELFDRHLPEKIQGGKKTG